MSVDAVLLAVASAFLFGAMTVAIRIALRRGALAEAGALATVLTAVAVTLPLAGKGLCTNSSCRPCSADIRSTSIPGIWITGGAVSRSDGITIANVGSTRRSRSYT